MAWSAPNELLNYEAALTPTVNGNTNHFDRQLSMILTNGIKPFISFGHRVSRAKACGSIGDSSYRLFVYNEHLQRALHLRHRLSARANAQPKRQSPFQLRDAVEPPHNPLIKSLIKLLTSGDGFSE